MIKKVMVMASFAAAVGAGSLVAPTPANASGPSDYAVAQCGNGGYVEKEYPTYAECYTAAVQFYFEQTGGGGGYGGGMTAPSDLPHWTPGSGCGATRIPCNPEN